MIRPDAVSSSLGGARLDAAVRDDARGLLEQGRTAVLHYGANGERRLDDLSVFVSSYAPRPRMIVFGAIDFAAAVARVGSFLGYRVTVCDARATFATARRFPDADEVVVEWPHRYLANTEVDGRTVLAVLTTTPSSTCRYRLALRLPVAYVGAMGSRLWTGWTRCGAEATSATAPAAAPIGSISARGRLKIPRSRCGGAHRATVGRQRPGAAHVAGPIHRDHRRPIPPAGAHGQVAA